MSKYTMKWMWTSKVDAEVTIEVETKVERSRCRSGSKGGNAKKVKNGKLARS